MSYAYRCETCNGRASWNVTRQGDVVTTWACHDHLARACVRLQRAHERTTLTCVLNEHHPEQPNPAAA